MLTQSGSSYTSAVEVTPFNAKLGALVLCGDVRTVSDQVFSTVYHAFLDNLVVLIRSQQLDDDELFAFASRFGEPQPDVSELDTGAASPQPPQTAHPEITVISNVVENGMAIGRLGDGEAAWHTDSSYIAAPPTASILHSLEVPPSGGNTEFSNMYLALDAMPPALLARIQGRTIRHHKIYTGGGRLRPGHSSDEDPRTSPGPDHPIISRHPETGHNALYLGRRHAHVNGLSIPESEALLTELWAHASKPEFTWHHEWQAGDILIWDNRCVIHRRDAFDPSTRRVMHRTQCKGTPVIPAAPGALPHPRGRLAVRQI